MQRRANARAIGALPGEGKGVTRPLQKGHRRSKRLLLGVPVLVYGRAADHTPFRDVTHTLAVNLHGGLVALHAPVRKGQTLLVVNSTTQEERECIAVYVAPLPKDSGQAQQGGTKVGFQFMRPAPDFWKIYFPTPGANLESPHACDRAG